MKHDSAPIEGLLTALADDHDVPRAVSEQIIAWFGDTKDGKWKMDVLAIVKEIGHGILRNYRVRYVYIYLQHLTPDSMNQSRKTLCLRDGKHKLVILSNLL